MAAVKEALGRFNAIPSIDFDTEGIPDIPVFGEQYAAAATEVPVPEVNPDFNPFKNGHSASGGRRRTMDWEPLYEAVEHGAPVAEANDFGGGFFPEPQEDDSSLYAFSGDIMEKSRLAHTVQGSLHHDGGKVRLMIIDQHRAHIRVLYERYRKQMEGRNGQSQGLLFPEMIQLPPSEGSAA